MGQVSEAVQIDGSSYIGGGAIETGLWKRAFIRLSSLPNVPSSFTRINFFNNSGSTLPAFYLDAIMKPLFRFLFCFRPPESTNSRCSA
ncbi:MAG TPA: hypothetical protein DCZ95_16365 [Verrucomicrobia bacterium]|nr:MAG: hypothetical protein A2X46_15790 [Lentisphaerae bacterium GWF2_57_35]HBA85656.1 hypothetical protein [Verrucomicrobiota bacterium]